MAKKSEKPITVYGAIIANFVIATTKIAAALFTGSSSMLSEGIHSTVDTGNQALLLLGTHLSRRPANKAHPFGHGKEIFFWGLVVAILLFGVGGGMSFYEGITHFEHPVEITSPVWNYAVLGIASIAEAISFSLAMREFLATKGEQGFWAALSASKDPTIFVVLLEDSAALIGLVIAAAGIFLAQYLKKPIIDGIASLLIGLLLGSVAIFLAYESRKLLLGESANPRTIERIVDVAQQDANIVRVERPYTMQMGPDEILLNLDVHFKKNLDSQELSQTIDNLEKKIQQEVPEVKYIFIEAKSIADSHLSRNGSRDLESRE